MKAINMEGDNEMVEVDYNLLETSKDTAEKIVQFLIAYHELKPEEFDWETE